MEAELPIFSNEGRVLVEKPIFRSLAVKIEGERGGPVVECRTLEREVGGSIPTAAVLCP